MELAYAFLANSAGHLQDGRLCIFGADIDGLEARLMPYVGPPLALVAGLHLRPDELRGAHTFRVELTTPGGRRSRINDDLDLNAPRRGVNPEGPRAASIVTNLEIGFQEPGEYRFHLLVDGVETATLPFYVRVAGASNPTANVNPSVDLEAAAADAAVEPDVEAASVAELKRLVPSNAKLLALASKRSPPAEWFEHDEESPF